ncbi:serine protein kinase RIO [Methylobacillus gramineus]|uniref:PA4780 family RIO1-like protein kinase n=1 Tax=Methylobacillus gramineus TaxID=755169 RepID=UPI001CFF64E0|nr:PA4780 family RIO1-like protein kinase [Methylobacillus gramineus]MCB5184911.1 serine protein kinase RIO [Methylobacillus gramineus]
MKIPKRLAPLVEDGLVDEVMRQLMSGKEAVVFVVRCGDDVRCAKVYKEAEQRSFQNNALYQEGRRTKNSRQARAMAKGSKYGRQQQEQAWQSHEVDTLHKLAAVGVRVPQPYNFYEGVLLMELVTGSDGMAAPRLNDVELSEAQALQYHAQLIAEVVKMLCAGVIHGDLSEFNILLSEDGPVIIDLPQAVDAAANNNAKAMLARDVTNLATYFGRFAPQLLQSQYGEEIWSLYEHGLLTPESSLSGKFRASLQKADVGSVVREIRAAQAAEDRKRQAQASPVDESKQKAP